MNYPPIENHGVIGNLHTVALAGMDGAIDFMCFPAFDSPSIFAALLDHQKGGKFQIAPIIAEARHKQIYLPDSNVLLTRFLSGEGVAEICDFKPVEPPWPGPCLLRQVKAIRGDLRFRLVCAPRFDYARAGHRVESKKHEVVFRSDASDRLALRLASSVPLEVANGDALAEFTLRAGQSACFALGLAHTPGLGEAVQEQFFEDCLQATLKFWRRWINRSQYRGRWRETVNRSALILKLLTSAQHGSIVAAPTFGLPETIGGERNWDYRYTWIRDSAFTLYALIRLGFTDEARSFFSWLERFCFEADGKRPLQIMYGLNGRRQLSEETLAHLEGYRGSAPVRIGNGAWDQLQLDIYGELLDSVYLYDKYGSPLTFESWTRLVHLVNWVCEHWLLPDEGIWEVRGGRQEFLFSRLMCWVAVDRAIRLAQKRAFPGPIDRWQSVREQIQQDIYGQFWNRRIQAFVQHKGSQAVDAASLLMPLVRFISPNDTHWFLTLRRIEEKLVQDSLVFRYDPQHAADDGLHGGEGTFNMCSFWYIECVSRSGEVQKARFLFEKALGYANHLGLYAEELGPCGEHLGNFPQAFSHLALISAAYNLDKKLSELGHDD
ncbi:MAG: glycoside hydrolase family 15 protein [Verrucomicrobia bacterium]|nr:glycoside hydrolase family 15 protein [Verrucomicrobiota bacterium]